MFQETIDSILSNTTTQQKNKIGRPLKNKGLSYAVRISRLEDKVKSLEAALSKVVDIPKKDEPPREPNWIPWKPAHKGPDVQGRKVSVMLRSGEIFDKDQAQTVDGFIWREAGLRTVIAYSVV